MASKEHNHQIQKAKAEGLKKAYDRLSKELDQRMMSWLDQLDDDDAEQRRQVIARWKIINTLITADYFKWMEEIENGQR